MIRRLFSAGALLGSLVCLDLSASADEATLPGKGFAASRYEELWTKSPFAVATSEAVTTSPDYKMVGMARVDGVSYVSLIDTQSPNQEHFLLSSDQPARGLTLVSVTNGHDAGGTFAVVKKGGESLTLKLDETPSPPIPIQPNAMINQPQLPPPSPSAMAGQPPPPIAVRRHPTIFFPGQPPVEQQQPPPQSSQRSPVPLQ